MELREYQKQAIDKLRERFLSGRKRIVLQAACAAGKTIIAAELARSALDKGKHVLFIVNRRDLVKQTVDKFEQYGIGNQVGTILAGEEPELARPVQVASFQTYSRRLKLDDLDWNAWYHKAELVIYDECHSCNAKTYREIIDIYKDNGGYIIGLSATPCRADGTGLGEVFEDIVTCVPIEELIDNKFLVPMVYYAPSKPDLSKLRTIAGDYEKKELGNRVDKPKLIGDIYDNWIRLAGDRPTIIFATNVKHSMHIAEHFSDRGIAIEHIDAHTKDDDRAGIYGRFEEGKTQVLTNVGICTEGSDLPWVACVVVARPTKSLGRWIQMAGRGLRPFPGKEQCVAKGTKILTDKGNIKIEDITLDNKVWDGISFVNHGGAVCKGIQKTITYHGLTATLDHEVMTNEGWKQFQEAANERLRIVKTGFGGEPLRFSANYITEDRREMGPLKSSCEMSSVRLRIYGFLSQLKKKAQNEMLSFLQSSCSFSCSQMALLSSSGCKIEMSKQEKSPLPRLWRKRDQIQFQDRPRGDGVDKEQSWDSEVKKSPIRSNKQQRELRAGKYKVDFSCNEYEQFQNNKGGKKAEIYKFQDAVSIYQICRQHIVSIYFNWFNRQRNIEKVGNAFVQTEREVWDIHNAGPLQRFTANGLLVHNCILLDHAGCVEAHGFVDEDIEWSLEGKKAAFKKKKPRVKEKTPMICEMCSFVFTGPKCPQCGYEVKFWGKKIEAIEAELQEIKRGTEKKRKYTMFEKGNFYGMLEWERRRKGYAEGWTSHKFKEKFGVWPNSFKGTSPIEPDIGFMNYLKHLRIKWAKSKANPKNLEATG